MKAVFIILNDLDYLEEILEKLVELDVKGATVLDSKGLAQAILESDSESGMQLFYNGPFNIGVENVKHQNKTIFSIVKAEQVEKIVNSVRQIVRKSHEEAIGFMFSMPVDDIYLIKHKKTK